MIRRSLTGHGECIQIVIAGRQRRISVITALVVVVLDIEAAQFRVFYAQRAARVVYVLSVQRLLNGEKTKCEKYQSTDIVQ